MRPDVASETTITPARSDEELRCWLDVRNRVVVDRQLTIEEVHHSFHRNADQVRLLAWLDGMPVGVAMAITDRLKPAGAMFAQVKVLEPVRRRGIGSALLEAATAWAVDRGGSSLQATMRDDDPSSSGFWHAHGFVEVERDQVVELDLAALDDAVAVEACDVAGIELVTLADRPDLFERAHAAYAELLADVPHHEPVGVEPLAEWRDCVTTMPGSSPAQVLLALEGEDVVGYAQVERPPAEPDIALHGLTGVVRTHRRRGIARMLKLRQLQWARANGIARLRTSNHEDNAAMRRLNEQLGYRPECARLLLRSGLPDPLGWDDGWRTAFAPWQDACIPARVARVDRGACTALLRSGDEVRAAVPRDVEPTVGDWVALRGAGDGMHVEAVIPRRSSLQRSAAGAETRAQVVAANVDVAFIVVSLEVDLNLRRIERFLAIAWQAGATPVVVLAKRDLAGAALDAIVAEARSVAIGVEVVTATSLEPDGARELRPFLRPGMTAVLLGQSGVGKSTLVNSLVGRDAQAVQDTRGDGKGRHTTTHRELLVLPGGAMLVDSPGIRAVRLWDAGAGVARTFEDIEQLVAACRFADCSHEGDPGCAVQQAVADGALDGQRLASYVQLQREQRWLQLRQDKRAQRERRRAHRTLSRSLRANPKPGSRERPDRR